MVYKVFEWHGSQAPKRPTRLALSVLQTWKRMLSGKKKKKKRTIMMKTKNSFFSKLLKKDGKIKLIRVGLIWASYKE